MLSSTKIKVKEDGSVASCADPNRPFHPLPPNTCDTCGKYSDVTCHDFVKQKESTKNDQRSR
jgi:hypothetical protein